MERVQPEARDSTQVCARLMLNAKAHLLNNDTHNTRGVRGVLTRAAFQFGQKVADGRVAKKHQHKSQ